MKKINVIMRAVALMLLLSVLTFSVCSCGGDNGDGTEAPMTGEITVVIDRGNDDFTAYVARFENLTDRSEGALSVLKYLSARAGDSLSFRYSNGVFSSVDTLTLGEGEVIAVYTSVASDASTTSRSIDYNGTTLYPAGRSFEYLSVLGGTFILFRLENA